MIFFKMRQVRVKPETFRYFHNSKTYYLVGTVLEPVIEDNSIIILKGSTIQLVFNADTLGLINLPDAKELRFSIADLAQQAVFKRRSILRFLVDRINEDDNWGSD